MAKKEPFFQNLEETPETDKEYKERELKYREEISERMYESLEKEGIIKTNPNGSFSLTEKGIIEKEKIFFFLTVNCKLKRR